MRVLAISIGCMDACLLVGSHLVQRMSRLRAMESVSRSVMKAYLDSAGHGHEHL